MSYLGLGLSIGPPPPRGAVSEILSWAETLAWWDASVGITVTGAGVSSWVDRKSGHTLVQATDANRPAWSATGFNGAPSLTFNGTTHRLSMESQPLPSGATPCEMWAVVQQDALVADATNRTIIAYGGIDGKTSRQLQRVVVSSENRIRGTVGNGTSALTVADGSTVFSTRHVVRLAIGASSSDISIDGGAATSLTSTPATGTTRIRIGATQVETPGGFWHGKIRDVLVTSLLSAEKAAFLAEVLLARRKL